MGRKCKAHPETARYGQVQKYAQVDYLRQLEPEQQPIPTRAIKQQDTCRDCLWNANTASFLAGALHFELFGFVHGEGFRTTKLLHEREEATG